MKKMKALPTTNEGTVPREREVIACYQPPNGSKRELEQEGVDAIVGGLVFFRQNE